MRKNHGLNSKEVIRAIAREGRYGKRGTGRRGCEGMGGGGVRRGKGRRDGVKRGWRREANNMEGVGVGR